MLENIISTLLYGLSIACVLSLIAIGLSLIFGFTGVINLTHGSFYALGAYILFAILEGFTGSNVKVIFLIGALLAFVVTMAIGIFFERLLIRHLYGKDVNDAIIVTFALQLIFISIIKQIWGVTPKPVLDPIGLILQFPGINISIPVYRIFIIIVTCVIYLCVYLFLTKTMLGKVIIAGIEDMEGVKILGINPSKALSVMFALGVALASLGGALNAPLTMVHPYMGFDILLYSFAIVAVGGLANIKGTFVAAVIIGESMAIASQIMGAAVTIVPFIILIMIFALKPEGLFGA